MVHAKEDETIQPEQDEREQIDEQDEDEDSDSPYTKEEKKRIADLEAGPMNVELKFLDQRHTEQGKVYYTETKDDDTPEQINWWEKYALCLTRYMSDDGKEVIRTSLQVNSEHLKKLLKSVVQWYPGESFSTKIISIDAPYHVLFHYRSELDRASKKLEKGSEAAQHYKLLKSFINDNFGEDIEQHNNFLDQGLMSYELLWTIFKPGKIAFTTILGQVHAVKVESYQYVGGRCPGLRIGTNYVDFDGDDFGTRGHTCTIGKFLGTAPISALGTVPQDLHPKRSEIDSRLVARGASFENFAGMHFSSYSGVALDLADEKPKRVAVNGRVVIDCKAFHRLNPDMEFGVSVFRSQSKAAEETRFQDDEKKTTKVSLTDDQRLMASGLVRGFAFGEKRFLDFYVDQLAPIQWNEQCFDQLVLASSHKQIVRALVSDHMQATDKFDDIVEGKGKGLIMVLHGPPGVGKTLTAECVSEYVKKPLYIVSSGDLGTDSSTLDENLSRILDMASTWKVVLLIDEADVFLEARSQHDLERNALVSIFLRVLEYYQGIMFLTTNRVDTFDDAFKSRIHVPLKYSGLSTASRKQIWKNFLSKVEEGVEIDEAGYEALSSADLNGRQIKNVIRTAKSLARYDHRKLDIGMLQQVVGIQQEFEDDLQAQSAASKVVKEKLTDGVNGVNGGELSSH